MTLQINDLKKTFLIHILSDQCIEGFYNVNFTAEEEQMLCLKGPSGAGKSSIMKCIYRTYLSDEGSVLFDSELFGKIDLAKASDQEIIQLRRTEIGYMTQFLKVIPRVSAVEVVAEPLIIRGVAEKEAIRQASELLERLYIPSSLFNAFPVTFSGGEQQRVNFAAGIIACPKLLLLDEPTASLDKNSMAVVIDLLMEMKNKGTTMVAIFHDHKIIDQIADNVFEVESFRKKIA